MELKPPIGERSTAQLITMAADNEAWQPEAQALARMELERRGVDVAVVHEAQRHVADARAMDLHQREVNARESYPVTTMVGIFLGAPLLLFVRLVSLKIPIPFRLGLTALDRDNYVLKYRQRMSMLVCGTLAWAVVLNALV